MKLRFSLCPRSPPFIARAQESWTVRLDLTAEISRQGVGGACVGQKRGLGPGCGLGARPHTS
jgi:hypothetical protein